MAGRHTASFRWPAGPAALIVLLAACNSPARPPSPAHSLLPPSATPVAAVASPSPEPAAAIIISNFRFTPENLRIKAGQTVVWTFADGNLPHTVTAFDRSFDSGPHTEGTFAVRFDTPGSYCYQCALHPGLNLCDHASRPASNDVSLLIGAAGGATGSYSTGVIAPAVIGGGHMQGKVVVEP